MTELDYNDVTNELGLMIENMINEYIECKEYEPDYNVSEDEIDTEVHNYVETVLLFNSHQAMEDKIRKMLRIFVKYKILKKRNNEDSCYDSDPDVYRFNKRMRRKYGRPGKLKKNN